MKLGEIASVLSLRVCTASDRLDTEVTGGYTCDLLSRVMAKAKKGNLWVTIQAHPNIVAVASLLELAGIIVAEDVQLDPVTVQKASDEGIPILVAGHSAFTVVSRLSQLGVAGVD